MNEQPKKPKGDPGEILLIIVSVYVLMAPLVFIVLKKGILAYGLNLFWVWAASPLILAAAPIVFWGSLLILAALFFGN